jgi:hypothetical protein
MNDDDDEQHLSKAPKASTTIKSQQRPPNRLSIEEMDDNDVIPTPHANAQYYTLFNHHLMQQRHSQQHPYSYHHHRYNEPVPPALMMNEYRRRDNVSFFHSTWFKSFIGMLLALAFASGASYLYKRYLSPLLQLIDKRQLKGNTLDEEQQEEADQQQQQKQQQLNQQHEEIKNEVAELRKLIEKNQQSNESTSQETMIKEDLSKTKLKLTKLQDKIEMLQQNNQELKLSLSNNQMTNNNRFNSRETSDTTNDLRLELAQIKGMLMARSQQSVPIRTQFVGAIPKQKKQAKQKSAQSDTGIVNSNGYSASYNYYDNPNDLSDSKSLDIGDRIQPFEDTHDIMNGMYGSYQKSLIETAPPTVSSEGATTQKQNISDQEQQEQNIQTVFVDKKSDVTDVQQSQQPEQAEQRQREDDFDYSMFDGHAPSFDELFQTAKSVQDDQNPYLKDLFQQPSYQPLDSSDNNVTDDLSNLANITETESEPKFQKSKLFKLFEKIGSGDMTINDQSLVEKKPKKKKAVKKKMTIIKKKRQSDAIETSKPDQPQEEIPEVSEVTTSSSSNLYDGFDSYNFDADERYQQMLRFTEEKGTLKDINESQREYAMLKLKAKYYSKNCTSEPFDFAKYCELRSIPQLSQQAVPSLDVHNEQTIQTTETITEIVDQSADTEAIDQNTAIEPVPIIEESVEVEKPAKEITEVTDLQVQEPAQQTLETVQQISTNNEEPEVPAAEETSAIELTEKKAPPKKQARLKPWEKKKLGAS